ASADGQFVWADARPYTFNPSMSPPGWSNATNTFNVRATGGVWFVTGIRSDGVPIASCALQPGVGSWGCISSRDANGVPLAAIQGLHQLMEEKDARIAALEFRIRTQERELAQLQQTVETLIGRIEGIVKVTATR